MLRDVLLSDYMIENKFVCAANFERKFESFAQIELLLLFQVFTLAVWLSFVRYRVHCEAFYDFIFLLQFLFFCGMNFHKVLFVLNAFNNLKDVTLVTYSDIRFDIVHLKFMVAKCRVRFCFNIGGEVKNKYRQLYPH